VNPLLLIPFTFSPKRTAVRKKSAIYGAETA